MLSQERKNIIKGIIKDNKQLLMLEPSEAVAEGKKLGHDFTLDELKEFAEEMKASSKLSDEMLDEVAGGLNNANALCNVGNW